MIDGRTISGGDTAEVKATGVETGDTIADPRGTSGGCTKAVNSITRAGGDVTEDSWFVEQEVSLEDDGL